MTDPYTRVLFGIGERLHMSAAAVEKLSAREVQGWIDYWNSARADTPEDDAVQLAELDPAARRAAFNHG